MLEGTLGPQNEKECEALMHHWSTEAPPVQSGAGANASGG